MKKAVTEDVSKRAADDGFDTVALWSAALWLAALLYLLATFDPIH